jgi:hypothetical protein
MKSSFPVEVTPGRYPYVVMQYLSVRKSNSFVASAVRTLSAIESCNYHTMNRENRASSSGKGCARTLSLGTPLTLPPRTAINRRGAMYT